ncbi:MAG TPA: heparan-alpha-glucosaminide N-acetyltransferase domain-containing protein [Candidatus Cybelea sp.]|nr:heparan-alpha-glucosaminide N-acetyltransferase domain-containing protein [Candidatus Cybelea sp.]
MAQRNPGRIAYIDWMRGLACLLMFQTHCYDSWLGGAARNTPFFRWSQLGGTLPAPLFLFLAGVSFALVTDRLRRKGGSAGGIASTTIRRGAEIFGLALLFRVQEFLLGQPWSPWTDLLRVDILNIIGVALMLMGLACWLVRTRVANAIFAALVAAAIAMATPALWTTWRPRWLPWYLESYLNGVHIYSKPQPWLFPIFPWAAFAFAGLAAGFFLISEWATQNLATATAIAGLTGVALFRLSIWFDARPQQLSAVYDYWHTSPNFFLARVGVLLIIVALGYAWCRWGGGQRGPSPLIQMGQTSLLVYWVHIEFVYGRFSILTKRSQSIPRATFGLLIIFSAMVLLSVGRTRTKGRGAEILARVRAALGGREKAGEGATSAVLRSCCALAGRVEGVDDGRDGSGRGNDARKRPGTVRASWGLGWAGRGAWTVRRPWARS